jgi:hypothetical protein
LETSKGSQKAQVPFLKPAVVSFGIRVTDETIGAAATPVVLEILSFASSERALFSNGRVGQKRPTSGEAPLHSASLPVRSWRFCDAEHRRADFVPQRVNPAFGPGALNLADERDGN